MTSENISFAGGRIYHNDQLLESHCAVFSGSRCCNILPESELAGTDLVIDLADDILSLGFCDLQVNGGGGVLLNDNPSVETISTIARAHRSLGTTCLLPTLITDTPEITGAAVRSCIQAIDAGVPGVAGLHLEGPHLSIEKKGAHKAELIRTMQADDFELLMQAAARLPLLKITVAPENVSLNQVKLLSDAGVLVSMGHTNASHETCVEYHRAGARCVTHLFNAMSQFVGREPGLAGTAFTTEGLYMGLIADGIHVHPASVTAALNCIGGLQRIYLVSDAMAVAATSLKAFDLNGRTIVRDHGRLTLEDGTLAGADLELISAIRFLVEEVGCEVVDALRAAVETPRKLLNSTIIRQSMVGADIRDIVRIDKSLSGVQLAHECF